MLLPEFMRRHVVAAAAAVGAIVGLIGGLAWPLPSVPSHGGGGLQLAIPPRSALDRYSEADFARLRNTTLWAGSAPAQGGTANMPSWQLVGVVLRPVPAALVKAENRQLRVAVGEALPDGTRLLAVRADAVDFMQGQCSYRRPLYGSADQPLPLAGCPSAATNDAATQAAGN